MQTKHLLTKNWMLNVLMFVLFTLCGAVQAVAVGSGTAAAPYIIEDGGEYQMTAYKPFYCVFTAPSDGTLTIYMSDSYAVYTDKNFNVKDESVDVGHSGANGSDSGWSIDCKSGVTYYLGNDFIMNGGTARVRFGAGAEELVVRDISPAAGSVFNAAVGSIDLSFNQSVQVGQVTMTVGDVTETFSAHVFGAYAGLEVKERLINLYKEGKVKAGDEIVFTFNGVAPASDPTKLYNGTGVVEVKYIAGAMPLMLEASTNTFRCEPLSV